MPLRDAAGGPWSHAALAVAILSLIAPAAPLSVSTLRHQVQFSPSLQRLRLRSSVWAAVEMEQEQTVATTQMPSPPRSAATRREQPYEVLRKRYDRKELVAFFLRRPAALAGRLAVFTKAWFRVKADWEKEELLPAANRTRGERLRQELALLGPVAVKLGQTLSQRPDVIPEDACEALKTLQTSNQPFPDAEAWRAIAQETGHRGPIAPGIVPDGCAEPDGEPLFRQLSASPIASASLGQVYRGTMRDGREVAVKVQRPGAMRQVALDFAVTLVTLDLVTRAGWGNGDLDEIIDTVAGGVFEELDYRNEAVNAAEYKRSMEFLGYVDVPRIIPELSTGCCVLVTEWVRGNHLDKLTPAEGLRMTYMAVEAVTASLVVTGLVHADPHEGNLMLADDGRRVSGWQERHGLVFLDFGLMSRVEPAIMEAFASGIQALRRRMHDAHAATLNRDYPTLVQAFIDTGFVGTPIEFRNNTRSPFVRTEGLEGVMCAELQRRMESVPGGTSRFGALSTVLFDMGQYWRLYTPPYIILLIRTFLTLEGIAGQVDPNFNIYEVSLPWAIQRALSPSTSRGAAQLRRTLLTPDDTVQWERLSRLLEEQLRDAEAAEAAEAAAAAAAEAAAAPAEAAPAEVAPAPAEAGRAGAGLLAAEGGKAPKMGPVSGDAARSMAAEAGSGAASPAETLAELFGAREGATLRRIASDLDSTELLMRLASREARSLRRMSVDALAAALVERAPWGPGAAAATRAAAAAWPRSETSQVLRRRRAARRSLVTGVLVRHHWRKQLRKGWRGAAAVGALALVLLRVGVAALAKAALMSSVHLPPVKALLPLAAAAAMAARVLVRTPIDCGAACRAALSRWLEGPRPKAA